jgi:predicted nucleic acid-binding protein
MKGVAVLPAGKRRRQLQQLQHWLDEILRLDCATALEHDLTIVTRNVKDFGGLGVVLYNPWDAI